MSTKNFTWFLFLFLVFNIQEAPAQFTKKVLNIMAGDSAATIALYDSIQTAHDAELFRKDSLLKESQLQQANLLMETETLRLQVKAMDSIKLARLKIQIDSLRKNTRGVPVVIEEDTLFYLYAKRGGNSPIVRAENIEGLLKKLAKKYTFKPDSIYIEPTEIQADIMYKDQVIVSVTDLDALWQNTSRNALADQWKNIIVKELKVLKKRHSLLQLIKRIFLFILVLAIQYGFYLIITRLYKKLKNYIIRIKGQKLKPIKIKDYELLNVNKVARMLIFSANMGRYLLIAVQLIITIPILFSIFPQTENLALRIFSYLWNPVRSILLSIRHYIPNFFTIIVIIVSIRFLIRGIKYLTSEIETQRLKIDGFYPDWAQPTYHIIRFLLYAFMVAMIYPYLPGSDTRVFQGISVFVGLIVSLGSSTVISNIIAGMVITYMRPFKLGDRIKLNDVLGNVTEKTPFVTRLKTPKNEIVTIPNSFVMSSHTTNYTASARTYGLIIHTEVTIGYDAPWRQVNQLLIDAALDTPGIEKEPIPFVLETSLNDWYPVYQINAFIKEADQQAHIMTLLLQSIQDHFNKAGVEIMSPTYIATRDGNQSTIPKGAGFPENITK